MANQRENKCGLQHKRMENKQHSNKWEQKKQRVQGVNAALFVWANHCLNCVLNINLNNKVINWNISGNRFMTGALKGFTDGAILLV